MPCEVAELVEFLRERGGNVCYALFDSSVVTRPDPGAEKVSNMLYQMEHEVYAGLRSPSLRSALLMHGASPADDCSFSMRHQGHTPARD